MRVPGFGGSLDAGVGPQESLAIVAPKGFFWKIPQAAEKFQLEWPLAESYLQVRGTWNVLAVCYAYST
jgi:hypothetical protein